jgi:colanic acid/amylovoran biosynthesis glycosyltransferase
MMTDTLDAELQGSRDMHRSVPTEARSAARRQVRLAYLTSRYPAVSHTFIRREVREIERLGYSVLRLAIRPAGTGLVDPQDQDEQARTIHCLSRPFWRLAIEAVRTIFTRPLRFLRALKTTVQMGWRSDRGLLRHLAYLTEAAYLLRVLRKHGVEHVHVHFGHNPAAVARLIHRMGGPGYSMTVHGTETFDAPGPSRLGAKVQDARFVVAVSDYASAQIRRWSGPEHWSKIHVVRCSVGQEFFEGSVPIDPAADSLVCVARLAPEKGQLLLLEAMAQVVRSGVETRLVLAGDGELRPEIEELIRALGLTDCVQITGWIDGAEVRRRILAARALVLPSFAEGLPVVLMEALALGRPVISTFVGGIPELVCPGQNGWLVPAGNVDLLAAAVREVMGVPVQRLTEMGLCGQAHVRQRHGLQTEVAKLDALFQQLSTVCDG